MSHKYKFHNPDGTYFITTTVHGWIDVFTRDLYKDILIENLKYCQANKGLEIFAWCIMTNHIHLIARATSTFKMSDIIRDFKKFSSREIIKAILENDRESRKEWLIEMFKIEIGYRFWKSGNHPIELWSNAVIHQKLNYIHQNPVVEGLVFKAEDYVYSSAINYAGGKGLLDVVLLS